MLSVLFLLINIVLVRHSPPADVSELTTTSKCRRVLVTRGFGVKVLWTVLNITYT